MGRPSWFRRRLAALGERYLLAVPSNTLMRDLETRAPAYGGQGRPPQRPWQGVASGATSLGDDAWRRIDVRDGAKARWWSRWSHAVWCPEPIGVSKATRSCWWSSATVTATRHRW